MLKKLLIVGVLFLTGMNLYSQTPSNDGIDGAINLTVGISELHNVETGTTVGSTDSTTDTSNPVIAPSCSNYQGGDVWYKTTVPSSGNINLKLTSTLVDYISVYSGTPSNLTLIDCIRQPNTLELTSRTPGEILYLRVWEIGNDQFGDFNIVAYENRPPDNDNINNAISLTIGTTSSDYPTTGTLINATDSANDNIGSTIAVPTCSYSYLSDVWYTVTVPTTGKLKIETTSSNGEYISVYSGTANNLSALNCTYTGNLINIQNRTSGEVLYIRIWERNTNQITDFSISAYDVPPPANDNISNATLLTVGTSYDEYLVTGTNAEATNSVNDISGYSLPNPTCGYSYSGGDVWYKAIIPSSGNLKIYLAYGSVDYFTLYSGSTDDLVEIGCGYDGNTYSLTGRTSGETIYIRAWESYNYTRSINISAFSPVPPSNDNINNATLLTVGDSESQNIITGTNVNATNSISDISGYSLPDPTCYSGYQGGDIWYKATVPNSGNISFLVNNSITNGFYTTLYSGTSDDLVEISCTRSTNVLSISNRTPGEILHLRVWEYNNDEFYTFNIVAFSPIPPSNDNINNATLLTVGDSESQNVITGTNLHATNSISDISGYTLPNPTCYSGYQGGDIWYKATVPNSGNIKFLVNNSSTSGFYSTVYSGTSDDLVEINCTYYNNVLSLTNRTPGETLYLRVWEYNNDEFYNFNVVAFSPVPPANDNIGNAIQLTVGTNEYENITTGTNVNATDSTNDVSGYTIPNPTCYSGYQGGDVWYTATIPVTGELKIKLNYNSDIDVVTIYSGTSDDLVEIACSSDGYTHTLSNRTPGEIIYLRVWEDGNDAFTSFEIVAFANLPPANDNINNAIDLPLNTSTSGTVNSATDSTNDVSGVTIPSPTCNTYYGGDIWYTITAPDSGNFSITTNNSTFNIALYSGTIDDLYQTDCGQSLNITSFTPGETLYVRFWTNATSGDGGFNITTTSTTPPSNDSIYNSTRLTVSATVAEDNLIASINNATDSYNETSSPIPAPGCASYSGGDIWYTITVGEGSYLDIETLENTSSSGSIDTGLAVYSGDPDTGLTLIECNDDGNSNYKSKISLYGQTKDEILYVRAWKYGSQGTYSTSFLISAHDGVGERLSTKSFKLENPDFKHYLNINDILILETVKTIENISVYNIAGNQLNLNKNRSNKEIDMSALSSGVYLVNITINGNTGTFKVIK